MYVEFKKLKFKNILSYGNQFTMIDFDTGLNLIKAPNGSGKSTILDALNFALFGKPFRDIKMAKLVNRINDKELIVEVEFNIGFDSYKIVRGLKPAVFELYKNGETIDMLSSKKLNQDEIDKLLGINQKLFKNIVGVAVTNNKPFLSMSAGEKRELIENIFNIDVLGLISKEVKKRKTNETSQEKLKLAESNGIENQINDNRRYIENMNQYISSFNETKERDLNAVNKEQILLNERLEKHNSNINIANKKLSELSEQLSDEPDSLYYSSILKDLGTHESEGQRLEKILKGLNTKSLCPICNSKLSEGDAKKHIDEMKHTLKDINENIIPDLKNKEQEYLAKKKQYDSAKSMIDLIKQKLSQEEDNKSNVEGLIDQNNQKLIDIENRKCPFIKDEYETKLTELTDQLTVLTEELNVLHNQIEIDKELINILGDDGIKVYFFRKLIPLLNQNINKYLKRFEMPIFIEFDDQMQETIVNGRNEMDYDQFSSGEKTRIDMSILLSFFNISRIISNWSCSLIFIDEILDGGIDKDGIEQFTATLYNIITENENKLGIYLVSHKLEDAKVQINHVLEISKKGIFSEIEVK